MTTETTKATAAFRAELVKTMPGYDWTIHKSTGPQRLEATGTQSSGSNRLSTLRVIRWESSDGKAQYEARSSGFGLRAPWLATTMGPTLAQALRRLQDHYQATANTYSSHAGDLQVGRGKPTAGGELARQRADLLTALRRIMDLECPLTGNPTHAELVEHWEYEKTQGRGEADDRLFALAAIARATGSPT